MKKVSLLFSLLLGLQLGSSAQNPVKWTTLDTAINVLSSGLIGSDETGTYLFCTTGDKDALFGISKVESGSSEVVQKELPPFGETGKYRFRPKCLLSDGHLWATIVKRDSKTKKAQLFAQAINKNTLRYDGEPKVVAEFDMGTKPMAFLTDIMQAEGSPYFILISRDMDDTYFQLYNSNFEPVGSKINFGIKFADFYMNMPFIKGGTGSDEVWTYDHPLYNSIYRKMMTGLTADSAGNVYVTEFFFNTKKAGDETRHGSYLFIYPKNAAKPIEVALDEDDGKSSYSTMQLYQGQVICAGFYSSMERILPEGTSYVRVNAQTGQVLARHKQALSENILKGLSVKKKELDVKAWADFDHHYFLDAELMGSGADVFIAFQHDMVFTGRPIGPPGTTANDIKSDQPTDHQIVAVHLSENGEILWQQKIPRDLRGGAMGDDPSSSFAAVKNGVFYAFYIDESETPRANHDNINAEQHPSANTLMSDSYHALVVATISAQGNPGRQTLTSLPANYALVPSQAFYDAKGMLLIPAHHFGGTNGAYTGYSRSIKKIAAVTLSGTAASTER